MMKKKKGERDKIVSKRKEEGKKRMKRDKR